MDVLRKNIIEGLKNRGLKKKHAADQLKIDPSYFNRMLAGGRWQLVYLERLAELMGVPVWRLFYESEDGCGGQHAAPDAFMLPSQERPVALDLNDFVVIPVVKLQVEIDQWQDQPRESLWNLFLRNDIVKSMAMGREPRAIELKMEVR